MRLKARPGSPGFSVLTCSAFSFYPPELQLRFLRNELAVGSGESHLGPNSDGSFHAWSSLTVKSGDEHHYRCLVQHVGLPQPLTVELGEAPPGGDHSLCPVAFRSASDRPPAHRCQSAWSLTASRPALPVLPKPRALCCLSVLLCLTCCCCCWPRWVWPPVNRCGPSRPPCCCRSSPGLTIYCFESDLLLCARPSAPRSNTTHLPAAGPWARVTETAFAMAGSSIWGHSAQAYPTS